MTTFLNNHQPNAPTSELCVCQDDVILEFNCFSYEISYGEGYWTGAGYLIQATVGLSTSDLSSKIVIIINSSLSLVSIILSLVMIILTSLNIVYTPFDISYFYHGDLSILLTLYYTVLSAGVIAAVISIVLIVVACFKRNVQTPHQGKHKTYSFYRQVQ